MAERARFTSGSFRSMVDREGGPPRTFGGSQSRAMQSSRSGQTPGAGVGVFRVDMGSMRRGRVVLGRGGRAAIAAVACCALANCSSSSKFMSKFDPRLGVSSSPRVVGPGEPVPKGGGRYTVGTPYSVGGRTYVPQENPNYRAEGLASWYGSDFHGRRTAHREVYDTH